MKKLLMMMAVAAAAGFASADKVVLNYLSLGPDTYASGKEVLEGEFYAFVFVKAGQTFAGFNADGTLANEANGEILDMGPWAKKWLVGVGCQPHNVQPEAEVASAWADGSLRLYVLDTRKADGKLSGYTKDAGGKYQPVCVNGYGEVASAKFSFNAMAAGQTSAKASVASALPAKTAKPRITGIRLEGGYAYIKVADTVPYLQYNVATGGKPGEVKNRQAAAAAKQGVEGQEIELKVPVTEASTFFRVKRNELETK